MGNQQVLYENIKESINLVLKNIIHLPLDTEDHLLTFAEMQ